MNDAIRINLLDWRETMREQRRRNFLGALTLTVLLCSGAIAFVTLHVFGHRIEIQQQRNAYLEQQIDVADNKMVELKKVKTKRAGLVQRMRIIEDLQQSRSWIVHYFDQIADTIPAGVFLTSLDQSGGTTTLSGIAKSNAEVSDYMVNLDNSAYLANPRLIVIKNGANSGQLVAGFTLRVENAHPDNHLRLADAYK